MIVLAIAAIAVAAYLLGRTSVHAISVLTGRTYITPGTTSILSGGIAYYVPNGVPWFENSTLTVAGETPPCLKRSSRITFGTLSSAAATDGFHMVIWVRC